MKEQLVSVLPLLLNRLESQADLYFLFGRFAARNIFARDSGRVRRTVMLPGAITNNNLFFLAGIACDNACAGRALRYLR